MDKKRYVEKEKKSILGIIICLVISIAVFIAVIIIQRAITGGEEKVTVVVANTNMDAMDFIVFDDAGEYFKEVEVAKSLAYQGVYSSISEMFDGKNEIYAVTGVSAGEIVSGKSVAACEEFLSEYEKPVAMGIKVASFDHANGGILRRGDRVMMCILDEMGEKHEFELYILQAFDIDGLLIEPSDTVTVAENFNVVIEQDEYVSVASIIQLGDFDLVKLENVR